MQPLRIAQQFERWAGGIPNELTFWDEWMKTKGLEWPDEYERRVKKKSEPMHEQYLVGLEDPMAATFLDVGSGPFTHNGRMYKGQQLDLTCVDPLAPYYKEIGARYGLTIDVQQAFAEDLCAFAGNRRFDRVICWNALDHSFDPVRGVAEMIRIMKIGGRMFLGHAVNESDRENAIGLHQWNFNEENGDFVISGTDGSKTNVTTLFAAVCRITAETSSTGWLDVTGVKLADFPEPLAVHMGNRNLEILSSMLDLFYQRANDPNPRELQPAVTSRDGIFKAAKKLFFHGKRS